jgi:mannitol-1-phosphate/altronate dehydrogenase
MTELFATPTLPTVATVLHRGHGGLVTYPSYDRTALTPAVVHMGVGGFHRSHQAVYFDDLAASGATGWGVVGVGIRRRRLGRVLREQDNLYTVVERGVHGSTARVIGSMVEYLLLADAPATVGARLRDPRTRLVTLTITGDGYRLPGSLNDPDAHRWIFPLIVDALDARRRAGARPFTVLSCDNLPDNGGAARRAVSTLAADRSVALSSWIDRHVSFPNSMVDRITPATSRADRKQVKREFGVHDACPVITEPFAQWVIEDQFSNGRPPLESAGVMFVTDVRPYKLIKSRLLNGSHSALGYVGVLAGYRRADEAMKDKAIKAMMTRMMREEVAPLLPSAIPGMDLDEYQRTLLNRLANPAIGDPLSRLCARGSTKMVDYVLPTLQEASIGRRPRRLLTLVVAAWLRYLRGTDLSGTRIELEDARADELKARAWAGQGSPRHLLRLHDIFGDLSHNRDFCAEVEDLTRLLDIRGVGGAIAAVLEGGDAHVSQGLRRSSSYA